MEQGTPPKNLSDWSYRAVCDLVRSPLGDTYTCDYQAVLTTRARQADVDRSIRKAACAFANTVGGFIVFGVADDRMGVTGIDRILGMEHDPEMKQKFAQTVRTIIPTLYYEFVEIQIPGTGDVLYVVSVPRGLMRPYGFPEEDGWQFWKREPTGSHLMSYEELRGLFLWTEERGRKLQLFYFEARRMRDTVEDVLVSASRRGKDIGPLSVEGNIWESLLLDIFPVIRDDVPLTKAVGDARKRINEMQLKTKKFLASGKVQKISPTERGEHEKTIREGAQALGDQLDTIIFELELNYGMDRFNNLYIS